MHNPTHFNFFLSFTFPPSHMSVVIAAKKNSFERNFIVLIENHFSALKKCRPDVLVHKYERATKTDGSENVN